MSSWFSMRPARAVLIVIALAAAGGWLVGSSVFDRMLARRWRGQIELADDQTAMAEVKRIASLGDAGLTDLAILLGSERLCVVESVRQALADQMRSWPALEPDVRRQRQLELLKALNDHIATFGPDARCVASDIALRILSMAEKDAAESDVVFACDQVLRAGAVSRRQRLLAQRMGRPRRDSRSGGSEQYDENRAPRMAALPGGSLLPAELPGPPLVEVPQERPHEVEQRPLASNEPARLPEDAPARMSDVGTDAELAEAEETIHHHSGPDTGEETEEDAGEEAAAELRLMFALRSLDPHKRQRAEEDLRKLGYEALQLELARQLTDPDPKVRRDLAESLPSMPGIDARTWLFWLSRDKAPDVRLAAMTVMATMGDPATMRRIEQMARLDADERIQRQGERLLKALEANARPTAGPSGRLLR